MDTVTFSLAVRSFPEFPTLYYMEKIMFFGNQISDGSAEPGELS